MERSNEDEPQPSCSGIQSRKTKKEESDGSDSDSDFGKKIKIDYDSHLTSDESGSDYEQKRQKKMKKIINGKIRGSSLYVRATDASKGNCLDEFCDELIKRFEIIVKCYEGDYDFHTLRVHAEEFSVDLESEIHLHWIVEDQTLTRAKMAGIQRIINEIGRMRRSVNFNDFIKYLRRSTDICFQLEWAKWEIDYISKFIMDVFETTAQSSDIYAATESSSSDEGYEN